MPILTETRMGGLEDVIDNDDSIERIHLGTSQEGYSVSSVKSCGDKGNDILSSKGKQTEHKYFIPDSASATSEGTPILTENEAGSLKNVDDAVDNKNCTGIVQLGTAEGDSDSLISRKVSSVDEENDVLFGNGKLNEHQHFTPKSSSATAEKILTENEAGSLEKVDDAVDNKTSNETSHRETAQAEPTRHLKGDIFVQNYNVDPKSGSALETSVQVIHYTAPLKSWPRVYKSQQLIKGMVDRSSYLERMLHFEGLQGQQGHISNELFQIDIYVHSSVKQSPESILVRGNAIKEIERLNIELLDTITDPIQDLLSRSFLGIFVDTYEAKLIETVSNTEILVRSLPESQSPTKELKPKQFTDFDRMKCQISSLLERIVFEKLTTKCKILNDLRMSTNPKYYTAIDDRENENYQDAVDDLLGEMIALFKRSKVPKDVHPVIEGYEKKQISEKVYKGLFNIDDKICGCGYRYSTFNVNIVHSADEKERMERIKNFLKKHEIYYVKFNFVTTKTPEYKYVGSKICVGSDETLLNATLGAYASFTKEGKTDPSALISKHLTMFSTDNKLLAYAKQDENPIEMGDILQESVIEGGYDIAAATIHEDYMKQCDVRFKNEDNKPKSGIIYTSDLGIDLQKTLVLLIILNQTEYLIGPQVPYSNWLVPSPTDLVKSYLNITSPVYVVKFGKVDSVKKDQYVHLWGSVSKPGLGKIRIPELIFPDATEKYMQVEDRDALVGEPLKNMALEGDSGAILCLEDLDDENIYVISMLIGGYSRITDSKEPPNFDDGEKAPGASSSFGNENAHAICTNVGVENCDPADIEKSLNTRTTDKNETSIAKNGIDMHQNSHLKSDAVCVNPESACSNSGGKGKNGTGDRRNVPAKRQYMTFLVHKGIEQLQNVTEGVFELKGIAEQK